MRYCFAVLSLLLPLAVGAEQFDLVCTNTDDMGPQEDVTLRVDTDQSTGWVDCIMNIRWRQASPDRGLAYQLNLMRRD
jgi:hypothetical protein